MYCSRSCDKNHQAYACMQSISLVATEGLTFTKGIINLPSMSNILFFSPYKVQWEANTERFHARHSKLLAASPRLCLSLDLPNGYLSPILPAHHRTRTIGSTGSIDRASDMIFHCPQSHTIRHHASASDYITSHNDARASNATPASRWQNMLKLWKNEDHLISG